MLQELVSHDSGKRHKVVVRVASSAIAEKEAEAMDQNGTPDELDPAPTLPEVSYLIKQLV